MPDELNLDSILRNEKKPELSQIDPEFYDRAAGHLIALEAELNRVPRDSFKYKIALNELDTARAKVLDILNARMGKIIHKSNSQIARQTKSTEPPSLTVEEKELYDSLIGLISAWKENRLIQISAMPEKIKIPEKPKFRDYITVRLLSDVPTFVGMDNRNYTLARRDVAMVPGANAKALIARKAAVQIVMRPSSVKSAAIRQD